MNIRDQFEIGRRSPRPRTLAVLIGTAIALTFTVPLAWASHQFTDVSNANPFHAEIGAIAGAGITGGKTCVPPGTPPTYCPDEPVVRQAMAAFMHRGFGKAAFQDGTWDTSIPLANPPATELAELTLQIGGVPGGTQFVKLDGLVQTSITSATGCPCSTQYWIQQDGEGFVSGVPIHTNADVDPSAGANWEVGAVTGVAEVPTGTTQTFRVFAQRVPPTASGSVVGRADLTALTVPFCGDGSGNCVQESG